MHNFFNFHKPGMRNVKTAISVFICIAILRLFPDNSPFYACIASVITMQNTMENSIKVGISRMIGTLIGATVGVILSTVYPNNIMLTALGIVVVIYIANFLKRNGSTAIACIVYLAIMVNIKYTTPFYYSLMRVMETFLGITVAVIVNIVVFPPKRQNKQE